MSDLPVKESLADYTVEEIEKYFDAYKFPQNPNTEDPERGDYLAILNEGADILPGKAFSPAISL